MRFRACVVTVLLAVGASRAHAAQHLMRVNEVLRSANGDGAIQYVELRDANGEPFPSGNYALGVYDADGVSLGTVTLTVPAGPPNTVDWFVATAAADAHFGTTRNDTLDVALPADGQVCFQSGAIKIHCVAWGCVSTIVGTAPATDGRGASPPDGASLQRNGDGSYFVGTPTPNAANLSGVPGTACPTAPDAGVGAPPDASAVTLDADPTAPDGAAGTPPDADPGPGADGGGAGCCRVGERGDAGGASALALATLIGLRRRRATA